MENPGTPAAGSQVPRAPPRVLGRYAIYDAIASGGMATVHYGRLLGPVGFSRTVAIKRLHPQYAQDPQFVTLFLDEARRAGRIRHPNVVATLDVVATANEIFLVMDYVHGEALSRIIREVSGRGQLIPLPIALRIASDSLQGLHAAHEARDEHGVPLNIVHRDVSPQNILLGIDGISRLVDFGVAKAAGQGATTREGHIKGKLGYMSPEQLRGHKLTRQSDVHGFAIVLWELLTGQRLFLGATEADTIARVVRHEITPASQYVDGLNPEIDAVLRRGLSDSLEDRFATAREMCIALEACGDIASTMQVADWVQAQLHDLLEPRTQVVSAMESNDHQVPVAEPSANDVRGPASKATAKEWVARLGSSPDIDVVEAPAVASGEGVDRRAPAASEPRATPRLALRWHTVAGAVAGLVGLALVVVASSGRGHAPVAVAAAATSAAPSAPPPPSAAPVVVAAPPPVVAPPVMASVAPPAPPAAPPPVVHAQPAAPRPPPKRPKASDDVFNTRE